MNEFVIASLVGLNLVQFVFWMWQTQKLLNKLMSRNYHDYVETTQLKPDVKAEPVPYDPEYDSLTELNRLIPRA